MILWTVGVMFVWIFMSIKIATAPLPLQLVPDQNNPQIVYVENKNFNLPTIPKEVLILLLGFTGWKTAQRFGEKSEEVTDETNKTP